jgi:hypothetical protein
MGVQDWYWLVGAALAVLTVYNTVMTWGRKSGATDAQMAQQNTNEANWNIRFDALTNALALHQAQTSDRFEKVVEKLNQALLTMAREHATKGDLNQVKLEIIDRIDAQYGVPRSSRRTKSDG